MLSTELQISLHLNYQFELQILSQLIFELPKCINVYLIIICYRDLVFLYFKQLNKKNLHILMLHKKINA